MLPQGFQPEMHEVPKADSLTLPERFQVDWLLSEAHKQREAERLESMCTCRSPQGKKITKINPHSDRHLSCSKIKSNDVDALEIFI